MVASGFFGEGRRTRRTFRGKPVATFSRRRSLRSGVAGIDVCTIDGRILGTSVRKGSPAEKAGIKTGWGIVYIDEMMWQSRKKVRR